MHESAHSSDERLNADQEIQQYTQCLLCPRPQPMLAALLGWDKRFSTGEQPWPWLEHNWLGLSALDILGGCKAEDQGALLSTLMLHAPVQYACVTRGLRQEGSCPLVKQEVPAEVCPAKTSSTGSPTSRSVWLLAVHQSLASARWHTRHDSPIEAAYLDWAHRYTTPLSRVRFVLLLLGCVVGIAK